MATAAKQRGILRQGRGDTYQSSVSHTRSGSLGASQTPHASLGEICPPTAARHAVIQQFKLMSISCRHVCSVEGTYHSRGHRSKGARAFTDAFLANQPLLLQTIQLFLPVPTITVIVRACQRGPTTACYSTDRRYKRIRKLSRAKSSRSSCICTYNGRRIPNVARTTALQSTCRLGQCVILLVAGSLASVHWDTVSRSGGV